MMFRGAWLLPLVVCLILLLALPQEINTTELSIEPSFTDSDNDGYNDSVDKYPNHPNAWSDADGDGFADQPNTNISDDCPNTYGSSRIQMNGCRDIDQDWIPDILDDDIDGDGISNELELASSNAVMKYDIFNSSSTPVDTDYDTIPDLVDLDDDNDGCVDGNDDAPFEWDDDNDGDTMPDDCDDDDDNDGVADDGDSHPEDNTQCSDNDGDTCDDCSDGSYGLDDDGVDCDGDGACDAGDDDDDNDGALDDDDSADNNENICSDNDGDTCDDCSDGSYGLDD
ncbi:MAG: hypothetical protein QF885_05065, partial [Candidatus Thalassarchaeaceae archaeon]|nr:hypothetical protein [Candidatus Thalassarchaeaceae archaeon]